MSINRRDILKGLATGAGAGALTFPAAAPALAQAIRTRRNLATAPATVITRLRTAVTAMQALPASNPRS